MKQTIWKFPFVVTDSVEIQMPKNAKILSVQVQNNQPCLWAYIPNADTSQETRHFRIYGTGNPIDEPGQFIGTFQLVNNAFVGHLFEV